MYRPRQFVPSFMKLAVVFGALVALVLGSQGVMAQGGPARRVEINGSGDDPGTGNKFVFTASGTWGRAHDAAIHRAGGEVDYSHGLSGIGVASSTNPRFLRAVMISGLFARGAQDVMVEWQKPTDTRVADEALTADAVTPGNDNFINLQWNMTAIDAFGAWGLGYDGAGVRVAVIDGGTCSAHPDLAPNIDPVYSASFVPPFAYNDETGSAGSFRHACHVAGIIAAVDNTIGTIGVAPKATIIALKALHGGSGSFAGVIQAILYAADPISAGGAGAQIINMSLGSTFPKGGGNTGAGPLVAAMNQAVNYATSKNVLVVSSAGNGDPNTGLGIDMDHSGSLTNVPAQSGSGIAVSATAPVGFAVGWPAGATNFSDPTTYTNYGHQLVHVSAPGGDSALPGSALCAVPRVVGPPVVTACWVFDLVMSPGNQVGQYFFAGGTSMAAPHVAGVAALIVGKYPGISVGDLKTLLARSAVDAGKIGADPFHGHGFVNAHSAVTTPLAP